MVVTLIDKKDQIVQDHSTATAELNKILKAFDVKDKKIGVNTWWGEHLIFKSCVSDLHAVPRSVGNDNPTQIKLVQCKGYI